MYCRILCLCAPLLWGVAFAQTPSDGYAKTFEKWAKTHETATYTQLGSSTTGRPIYVLTLSGHSQPDNRPALAIVAGTHRQFAYTRELVQNMLDALVKDTDLLQQYTLYVIPEASPEECAIPVGCLPSQNAQPHDDDKDARTDEDPADDLNKDGIISYMRYTHPAGDWVTHPLDSRLLVARSKIIEAGMRPAAIRYKRELEGLDDDGDGAYNEDGIGGTAFEQNWPWNYNWFATGSGMHPVSSPESRAVADFLFEKTNCYAVFVLGPGNNLGKEWEEEMGNPNLPQSELSAAAKKLYKYWHKRYTHHNPRSLTEDLEPSGFLPWLHFHYGRLALGSTVWQVPDVLPDTVPKALRTLEFRYMAWADSAGHQPAWLSWQTHSQEKLPQPQVEIGGLHCSELHTPPKDTLSLLVQPQVAFVQELLGAFPKLDISPKLKQLDKNLWQLRIEVSNAGQLPTHTEIGEKLPFIQAVVCEVKTENSLEQGHKRSKLPTLQAGEEHTLNYLISGNKPVEVTIGSPTTGSYRLNLQLK